MGRTDPSFFSSAIRMRGAATGQEPDQSSGVVKHFVPPLTDDTGMSLEGTEKYYQTAMIQTWNKFCFSRSGIVAI